MVFQHGVFHWYVKKRDSEGTRVYTRVVWKGEFPQRLLELALKDIFDFMYERE